MATELEVLSPSTASGVRPYLRYLAAEARSGEAITFLLQRHWNEDHDHRPVVRHLLGAAGLLAAPPSVPLAWDEPPPAERPNEVDVKMLHTLRHAEALAWVYRQLHILEISTCELQPVLDSLLSVVFSAWEPENWAMALHLSDEGLLNPGWIRAHVECPNQRVSRHLQLLCAEKQRWKTTTQSLWHLNWGEQQYPFFNYIGGHYHCFRCAANAECQVVGCYRRPSDCFCPNFAVRGKTFRYEWKHPLIDEEEPLHVCGACGKSGLYYKQETVDNHRRATEKWNSNNGKGRMPKETTFPRLEIDDGRAFQIGFVEEAKEWFLCEHLPEGMRVVRQVSFSDYHPVPLPLCIQGAIPA